MKSGAVDHIALDVKDIEKTYELINQEGLTLQRIRSISCHLGKWSEILYNRRTK